MLNLLFTILMLGVFGRLTVLSIRMAWGITKVIFVLLFLPIVLVIAVCGGLIRLAFPVLAIIGIISLFDRRETC